MKKLNAVINHPVNRQVPTFWIDRCPELRVPKYISVGTGNKRLQYRDYLNRAFNIEKYGSKLLVWLIHMVRCNEGKPMINIVGDCAFCKRHNHIQILIGFVEEHYDTLKTLITYVFSEDDPYMLPMKLPELIPTKQLRLVGVLKSMAEGQVEYGLGAD